VHEKSNLEGGPIGNYWFAVPYRTTAVMPADPTSYLERPDFTRREA
jgi:hypothetical protein